MGQEQVCPKNGISSPSQQFLRLQWAAMWVILWAITCSEVQFSPLAYWVIRRTWWTIQQESSSSLFCRRPLWAVPAWARMSTHCLSSTSSADQGSIHLPRLQDDFGDQGCCGTWHATWIKWVSISWHLPEEIPVGPQRSGSCSAPSCSCAQIGDAGKFNLALGLKILDPFLRVSRQVYVPQPKRRMEVTRDLYNLNLLVKLMVLLHQTKLYLWRKVNWIWTFKSSRSISLQAQQ